MVAIESDDEDSDWSPEEFYRGGRSGQSEGECSRGYSNDAQHARLFNLEEAGQESGEKGVDHNRGLIVTKSKWGDYSTDDTELIFKWRGTFTTI